MSFLVSLLAYATLGQTTSSTAIPTPSTPPAIVAPAPRREFRGVWVASVANIDWPSKPGLSTDAQKSELRTILDRAQALHLNAVLLQVRPACDALYASPYEPWSEYLTGTMGKAPDPLYDPLEFAVSEAHQRGLELHAWFNPFRARFSSSTGPASSDHVSVTHPERIRPYGKQTWLDPGLPEVREYSLKVIADVVARYDIDGVHIDDYFYPYPEKDAAGNTIPFPDAPTYAAYQKTGGTLSLDDWRRDNLTQFIRDLYSRVHAVKPWVKVGISPFGIPSPGNPPQIKGFDARAELYADSVQWLNNGWCDYFAPQLYWPIDRTAQSFPVLLGAWIAENKKGRHLWPGVYTSKYDPSEIAFEVKTTRGFDGATGAIHFSMTSLLAAGPGTVGDTLAAGVYADTALVPASPWLAPAGSPMPDAPTGLTITAGESPLVPSVLRWSAPTPCEWVVQARTDGATWHTFLIPSSYPPAMALPAHTDAVSVAGIDRFGRLGAPATRVVP